MCFNIAWFSKLGDFKYVSNCQKKNWIEIRSKIQDKYRNLNAFLQRRSILGVSTSRSGDVPNFLLWASSKFRDLWVQELKACIKNYIASIPIIGILERVMKNVNTRPQECRAREWRHLIQKNPKKCLINVLSLLSIFRFGCWLNPISTELPILQLFKSRLRPLVFEDEYEWEECGWMEPRCYPRAIN